MTTNQPPVLPVPRYPSPLSLGMDTLGVDLINGGSGRRSIYSNTSSPVPSVFESDELESSSNTRPSSSIQYPQPPSNDGFKVPHLPSRERMPIRPSPDSIIHRTTLKQLESQTVTLKRLTKTVLANLAVVAGIYEQLDRAEDEMLGSLGELATWMGHGYGLKDGVWDPESGVRRVKREKRKREKEDLEVMVLQGVDNVRGELQRRGLAGGGATAKYEVSLYGGRFLHGGQRSLLHKDLTSEIATRLLYSDWSLPGPWIKLNDSFSIHVTDPRILLFFSHGGPGAAVQDCPNGSYLLPTPLGAAVCRSAKFTHLSRPPR